MPVYSGLFGFRYKNARFAAGGSQNASRAHAGGPDWPKRAPVVSDGARVRASRSQRSVGLRAVASCTRDARDVHARYEVNPRAEHVVHDDVPHVDGSLDRCVPHEFHRLHVEGTGDGVVGTDGEETLVAVLDDDGSREDAHGACLLYTSRCV